MSMSVMLSERRVALDNRGNNDGASQAAATGK
jgi:hypothetical protein